MSRTPVLERTSTLRILGVGFIALLLVLVWVTYGVFTKAFVNSVKVDMFAPSSGLQLRVNSDVKMRGVIVGSVRSIESDPSGRAKLALDLNPDEVGDIPADVTALIIPKTLFGEKYVDLQLADGALGSTESISAGDVIEKAVVPAEVEDLLNDIYPLLRAVKPEDLSYTLNAVANALEGRGDKLGQNLENLDAYLAKLETVTPELVDDIVELGEVSEVYGDAMPDIGRLLRNAVKSGNTVVDKEEQLADVFATVTAFSGTTNQFVTSTGDAFIRANIEGRPTLSLFAGYAPLAPCVTRGVENLLPRLNEAFRDNRINAIVGFGVRAVTPYTASEVPTVPSLSGGTNAGCRTLPNSPYGRYNPAPGVPTSLLQQFGIKGDHNKFGDVGASTSGSEG